MLLRPHPPAKAEPCAQLQRFFRRIRGRAFALPRDREQAAGWSVNDWIQIENELAFRDSRRPC